MNNKLIKISSTLLAFLVLLSTFSLNVEKHFCGDFLVDISFFGDTNGCGDEVGEKDCDKPSVIKEKKCCKDEIQKIEGQDDLSISSFEKITFKQQFALAFTITYNNLFTYFEKQIVNHNYYSPPKLTYDIQILHEVFII